MGDHAHVDSPTFRETPVTFLIGLNLYVASLYLNIAVTAGGFVIPGVLALAGAVLLIRHIHNLLPVAALVGFLTLSLLAGGSGPDMLEIRLPSYAQIVAAIVCAHILLCAMTNYAAAVRKTLLIWVVFITVGVVLETVLPPFREISDTFREWAFAGRFIYASDARDLSTYGVIRPKLFSQEPSHVSKAFIVTATGWYLLSERRIALLLTCTVIATIFLRSPFVLLTLPLALFLKQMGSSRPRSGVLLASIPIVGIVAVAFTQIFPARFAMIMSGRDFSFFSRYLGPYRVAAEAVREHPVFGVGIGAKEYLWQEMRSAYAQFFNSPSAFNDIYLDYFNNAFANSLMFFGIAGAAVFYFLIAHWANSLGIRAMVSLPVVVLFFHLDGALEGVRMWSSVALILGCYLIARSRNQDCRPAALEDSRRSLPREDPTLSPGSAAT